MSSARQGHRSCPANIASTISSAKYGRFVIAVFPYRLAKNIVSNVAKHPKGLSLFIVLYRSFCYNTKEIHILTSMVDLSILQSMIRESLLLTDPERAYWLAGLARMTPPQMDRLKSILDRARNIPWNAALQNTVAKLAGTQVTSA